MCTQIMKETLTLESEPRGPKIREQRSNVDREELPQRPLGKKREAAVAVNERHVASLLRAITQLKRV